MEVIRTTPAFVDEIVELAPGCFDFLFITWSFELMTCDIRIERMMWLLNWKTMCRWESET